MALPLTATYRLQVHEEFTLEDARRIVPYLERLGVSHVYSSPILRARPGSTHGYDVADPAEVNPELGGDPARRALVAELRSRGMGLILDIVPNHMGTGPTNPYWEDVLAHGQRSRYAKWFDIDWDTPEKGLRGRVMVATLGDELDAVLERGELSLALVDGAPRVKYFDNNYPLDPDTLRPVYDFAGSREAGPLEEALARFGEGDEGRQRLRALLDAQPYALTSWRRAAKEINYRRFFDINELIALRQEDPSVFTETHRRLLEWVGDGSLAGLRIDHIDGLLDPAGYLERLRGEVVRRRPVGDDRGAEPFPVFVEKILSPGEELREDWPVQGTTGYEFLNDLEAIFIDAGGAAAIEETYRCELPIRDLRQDFHSIALRGKRAVLEGALASDVRRLARLLEVIARRDPRRPRLTPTQMREAIVALIAELPVYRTYIDERTDAARDVDAALVQTALSRARDRDEAPADALSLVAATLVQGRSGGRTPEESAERLRFIGRFQQTSGPATAKGVEDTALYVYVPLASRNEVGGEPDRDISDAVRQLHAANAKRARRWPRSLLATNTHDTKRSADVRARIDVLSEIAEEWAQQAARWRRMHRDLRRKVKGKLAPDVNTEYLLYQTLVGVWDVAGMGGPRRGTGDTLTQLRERVETYMEKAMREAKTQTSWVDPNPDFEGAVTEFLRALLTDDTESPFLQELSALVERVARPGLWNALGRVVVHLTSPGTPDTYQGDELWNFSLVDPDNRRAVDYALRERLLGEIEQRFAAAPESYAAELLTQVEDGRLKLHVTSATLHARRERHALFRDGAYDPLQVSGARAPHVFAYARGSGDEAAIVIVPRLTMSLTEGGAPPIGESVWRDTAVALPSALAGRRWTCALSGVSPRPASGAAGEILLGDALGVLPVALLLSDRG